MWKKNVYFILVEPREPGNIGSAARAMKNMGFGHLELVNPADYLSDETRLFARNSVDIIKHAKVYGSFAEAIGNKAIVIGTTRRTGKTRGIIFPFRELAARVPELAAENKIAVVFGREDRGLTNEEIGHCGFLTTIPTHPGQPSLNLAHAVLIAAYELSHFSGEYITEAFVSREKLDPLYERMRGIVKALGYLPRGYRDMEKSIMRNIKNILGRSGVTEWEYRMLLGLASRVEELIGENKRKLKKR